MTQIKLKRIYEDPEPTDGYRIFVDRLWPRGMKKEAVHFDLWEKDITPSPELRGWFHQAPDERWNEFAALYRKELNGSEAAMALWRRLDNIRSSRYSMLLRVRTIIMRLF